VVAARLSAGGQNGEAILQNMINTNKAEVFIVGAGTPHEATYVRIKSYEWRNETGMTMGQSYQGVQTGLTDISLEDLVGQTMETLGDFEGQYREADSMFAPLAISDPRLLANNAQSMETYRQFGGQCYLSDFFIFY
jgi:hypothetical protein